MDETEIKEMANILKALGEPSRLKIFQYLSSCCESFALDEEENIREVTGVTVGDICCKITGENNITSTLSHHLKELRYTGLINMEKRGKNIFCSINIQKVKQLSKFLGNMTSSCCVKK